MPDAGRRAWEKHSVCGDTLYVTVRSEHIVKDMLERVVESDVLDKLERDRWDIHARERWSFLEG